MGRLGGGKQSKYSTRVRDSESFIGQAAARRKRTFTSAGVPNLSEVNEARISALRPLQVDDYGTIVNPTGVSMR